MMLLLMLLLQKSEEKKFWGHFPHFWARGTENRINTGRSINHDQVEILTCKSVCVFRCLRYTVAK